MLLGWVFLWATFGYWVLTPTTGYLALGIAATGYWQGYCVWVSQPCGLLNLCHADQRVLDVSET